MQTQPVIGPSQSHRGALAETSQEDHPPVSAYCPITQKWTIVATQKGYFSMPGGQARWWSCEECQGWHVMMEMGVNPQEWLPPRPGPNFLAMLFDCYKKRTIWTIRLVHRHLLPYILIIKS